MKSKAQPTNAPLPADMFKWKISRAVEMKYLFYLPKDYNAKSRKRWPLMLFLHGAGERGTNVQRVAIHGPMSLVKQGTNFPFIIVAPLCAQNERWSSEILLAFLDKVLAKYFVDANRIYLTGLSMGGYGTWSLGIRYPEKFAAIVPICGGGEAIDVIIASREKMASLKTLPVWAFHGAKDTTVPVAESQRMVDVLKSKGCKEVKLTVYPEATHNSWTETYNNPELYEWLLKHSR